MTPGNCSVAVPVGCRRLVIAALGIVAHSVRAEIPKLVKPLLPAADGIRKRLLEQAESALVE